MKIQNHKVHYSNHPLHIRILVTEEGYWAVDASNHLIHNDKVICPLYESIDFGPDAWIHLYKFDDNCFILFDGNYRKGDNIWIINKQGAIIRSFSVDDGVFKIHIQQRKIIVAYSEVVIGSAQRVAIFDEFGKLLKDFDCDETDWEVKGFCRKSEHEMIIQSYDKFDVQVLNLNTFKLKTYKFFNNRDFYYPEFITYSPTSQYLYFGSRDDSRQEKIDPNSVHMNIFRGKLDENSDEIRFVFFDKINYFYYHIPLDNAKVLEVDFKEELTKTDQFNYSIIDFENS